MAIYLVSGNQLPVGLVVDQSNGLSSRIRLRRSVIRVGRCWLTYLLSRAWDVARG
jgi:hypothetical protein